MNDERVPTKARLQGGWTVSTTSRILKDEKYSGRFVWNRTTTAKDPLTGNRGCLAWASWCTRRCLSAMRVHFSSSPGLGVCLTPSGCVVVRLARGHYGSLFLVPPRLARLSSLMLAISLSLLPHCAPRSAHAPTADPPLLTPPLLIPPLLLK
jgi:recombinase